MEYKMEGPNFFNTTLPDHRGRTTQKRLIELCQESQQLDEYSQETELIDCILMLSDRHLDESNPTINCDFADNIYITINK